MLSYAQEKKVHLLSKFHPICTASVLVKNVSSTLKPLNDAGAWTKRSSLNYYFGFRSDAGSNEHAALQWWTSDLQWCSDAISLYICKFLTCLGFVSKVCLIFHFDRLEIAPFTFKILIYWTVIYRKTASSLSTTIPIGLDVYVKLALSVHTIKMDTKGMIYIIHVLLKICTEDSHIFS